MKNETQRAAITAIIDEIEQTQQAIGFSAHHPNDSEARQTIERIERRLFSIDLKRPVPEDDNWISLGDAAMAALAKIKP